MNTEGNVQFIHEKVFASVSFDHKDSKIYFYLIFPFFNTEKGVILFYLFFWVFSMDELGDHRLKSMLSSCLCRRTKYWLEGS